MAISQESIIYLRSIFSIDVGVHVREKKVHGENAPGGPQSTST